MGAIPASIHDTTGDKGSSTGACEDYFSADTTQWWRRQAVTVKAYDGDHDGKVMTCVYSTYGRKRVRHAGGWEMGVPHRMSRFL